jgi:hypothetical protein
MVLQIAITGIKIYQPIAEVEQQAAGADALIMRNHIEASRCK